MRRKGQKQNGIDSHLKYLGERIRALRIAKGYSNYEYFAFENGISSSQYARYERGEDMRFSTLAGLMAAFKMTPAEFFDYIYDIKGPEQPVKRKRGRPPKKKPES